MGIDCRFMIGGLEKWLVEGRPLTGLQARTLDDLRALPPYRNQGVLLDTPEVRDLVEKENAIFVDLRYPGEFAHRSHSGRRSTSPSARRRRTRLRAKIAQLPRKPIIIPCYDRRSCFYRRGARARARRAAGHDFRGRYTVPWDYFVRAKPRPYHPEVAGSKNETWWDKAASWRSPARVRTVGRSRRLHAAILLLAAVSRLLVLPVSLKAERDQIRSRALQDEVEAMKAAYADDPEASRPRDAGLLPPPRLHAGAQSARRSCSCR